ncbi:MAG: sulfur carrier protein ThiS [Clostridiales bacterium]|jgi:sulfur carrier protein|nr:sulfur carrier protein ThiS [Clostridiales bacterium]
MKLNGKIFKLSESVSVLDFIKDKNYNADRVAVEVNGKIVPKAEFEKTTLKDDDEVEIVCFVGGG